MKRSVFGNYLLCLCLLLGGCARQAGTTPVTGYILIDPGHGGFDGGTVAADGTNEKHVNLAVSLLLRDMMQVCGFPVQITRQTDCTVGEVTDGRIRDKKVQDIRNRLALYENASLVISIHQNHFAVPKYRGTQVFYSVNHPESVQVATRLQQRVACALQPENNRQIKPATDGIYLLHHTTVPAVLVECGFLSNPQELEQLKQQDYQQQLAFALLWGCWDYYTEE